LKELILSAENFSKKTVWKIGYILEKLIKKVKPFRERLSNMVKYCENRVSNLNKDGPKKGKEEGGGSFSIKDVNNFTCCEYKETPFIFFVKNNVDYLLNRAIFKLSAEFGIRVGVELEFFSKFALDIIADSCWKFCAENNVKIVGCVEECVKNQYEIQFDTYNDIHKLIEDFNKLKQFLAEAFGADFRAKPKYFSVGSALQINLNLEKSGENAFGNGDFGALLLQRSVNGLIYYTNYFLPFYIGDASCLDRYNDVFNRYLHGIGLTAAPSFNACGVNNRTASIRIPTPKNFRDRDGYLIKNKQSKRLEFRVPSSNANIKLALYGVLSSVYIGIKRDLPNCEFTSNNLLLSNFNYSKIQIKEFGFKDIKYWNDFF
jgi:hypothetical protein